MKGLVAYIFKDTMGDSSNGGISSKYDKVVVVGSDIPEIFEADETMPAVKIVRRMICGSEYIHAEPVEWEVDHDLKGMAGGTFIYTTDSRFRELVNKYPVSLHDRGESQKTYDRLSV